MVALSIGGFFYGVSGLLPGRSRGRVSDAQMTGPLSKLESEEIWVISGHFSSGELQRATTTFR